MAGLLRISEIHELAEVGRIPEAAVTEDILKNVAELDEKTQLEPWIQDIIHSYDETPHGPTEIADIITPRVTVRGQPTYAAFILKGKGTPRVSSRSVGHQFLKLNQLVGLELAALLAVGDIQDDAHRDFITNALNIGCDYLVIPQIDVARLLIAYDKICPEDGLPFANGICPKGHPQRPEIELNYKVREDAKWELLKLGDVSHGLAKRLSAIILTDRHYTQDLVRTVIAEAVPKIRTDPYVRSKLVRAQWGKSPAHVVWIYLGLDMDDVNDTNWVCMACWIDSNLDESYRPFWKYDELYEGIMIKWNSDYQAMKRLWAQYTGGKDDVIQCVESVLERMQPILELLDQTFIAFRQGAVTEQSLAKLIQRNWKHADKLYRKSSECPSPPPECADYKQQFSGAMAYFHNLFLLYTSDEFLNERTTENRTWLFNRNLNDLKDALRKLEYEREKL